MHHNDELKELVLLFRKKKLAEAKIRVEQLIVKEPQNHDYLFWRAKILLEQGQVQAAESAAHELLKKSPYGRVYDLLRMIAHKKGDWEAAIHYCGKLIAHNPKNASAYHNMANYLVQLNRPGEASIFFKKASDYNPKFKIQSLILHYMYKRQALKWHTFVQDKRAIEQLIDEYLKNDNLQFPIPLYGLVDFNLPIEKYREIGKKLEKVFNPARIHLSHAPKNAGSKIRLGYASASFRKCAGGFLSESIFPAHNRERFEIFAYHDHHKEDELTGKIRSNVDHFRNISGLTPYEAAKHIAGDELDVLIVTSMFMNHFRSAIISFKPAPVIINFLGYHMTTGFETVDYYFTDETISRGSFEQLASEKLVYLSPTGIASPGWDYSRIQKTERSDKIILGAFHNPRKLSLELMQVWAEILKNAFNTELWMLDWGAGEIKNSLKAFWREHGLTNKVKIHISRPYKQYLALLKSCDLYLDAFDFNAHTTALEALKLGVPVVTKVGEHPWNRYGLSFLRSLGLQQYAFHTSESYAHAVIQLCNNPSVLGNLQQQVRRAVKQNSLFDVQKYVGDMEDEIIRLLKS